MNPSPEAARFVAFFCFLNSGNDGERSPQQAGKLARENWKQFLPYVTKDLNQLLTPKGAAGEIQCRRPAKGAKRKLAAAC